MAAQTPLPPTPLTYGFFTVQFAPDGAFTLEGEGWPTFVGTWKVTASAGDVTLKNGETSNAAVVWSKTGRGSYMPTPLAYDGQLFLVANNGVCEGVMYGRTEESLVARGARR